MHYSLSLSLSLFHIRDCSINGGFGGSRHRWTGRFEAHLWDRNWNDSRTKKGRQGAYSEEEAAARAYDLAALKFWGHDTLLNFPEKKSEEL
ncbi:unnamed protein product [Spirodela intermedia]|uniref:AP2/ERF domain-containing protein n=1 Tax=Spirodela intermedia TaxID=51605 RepID=A0A7I8JJB4_SPIIN|nr:unnamed protein product [Spirodela intermedia]CAA6670267.1 unnamed protein product [Spirodela intermedia]